MKVVGRGNANILVDYGDPKWLYRCCVRFPDSLKKNNEYTVRNFEYISGKVHPILGDALCPMEMIVISLDSLGPLISQFISEIDDTMVIVLKILNLKSQKFHTTLYADHFTKLFSSSHNSHILMEFKPKWLHNPFAYCRNCTHNILKGREMRYCYAAVLSDASYLTEIFKEAKVPHRFISDVVSYFGKEGNILQKLFNLQKKLSLQSLADISCEEDVSSSLLLEMALRDVTCFLAWQTSGELSCQIVDVDLKPKEKWGHWVATDRKLGELHRKVYHD